jgi:hypothetical protein
VITPAGRVGQLSAVSSSVATGAADAPMSAAQPGHAAPHTAGGTTTPGRSTERVVRRAGAPSGVALATLRTLAGSILPDATLGPALRVTSLPVRVSATGPLVPAQQHGVAGAAGVFVGSVQRSRTPTMAGTPAATTAAPTLFAMTDLLAATRPATRGAAPEATRPLATAFGAAEEIRPAGAARPAAPGATPGPIKPYPSAERFGPRSPVRPAGPAGTEPAARAFLPAPPPISIRRASRSTPAPATKPAPPVATQAPGSTEPVRRSLVESTAHLFEADMAHVARDLVATSGSGGSQMAPSEQNALRAVPNRDQTGQEDDQPDVAKWLLSNPRQLHQLVDAIVDRLERRVVDELERRGRRHNLGAF